MTDIDAKRFHGWEIALRSVPGALATRVVHPSDQRIGEHRHDLCCLTIPIVGSYTECVSGTETRVSGPAAVLHPAGEYHSNEVCPGGLETISIQFDVDWLRRSGFGGAIERSMLWLGGQAAVGARRLAAAWSDPTTNEDRLGCATASFVAFAMSESPGAPPAWLKHLEEALLHEDPPGTMQLAQRLGMHPAWLARAYRAAVGEGLQDAVRRLRVARAVGLLRETDSPIASVAAEVGFSDQSHMGRAFRCILGRTPLAVRHEQPLLSAMADALHDAESRAIPDATSSLVDGDSASLA